MFQDIEIENIPDDVFARLVVLARSRGQTVEDMVRGFLIAAAKEEDALSQQEQRDLQSD